MIVPAHADREGVTVIIGEATMATVFKEYCIVTDPPENFTVTDANNQESSDEAEEIETSDIQKVYSYDEDAGEMSSDQILQLQESIKTACENKPIRRTNRIVVNETTFNQRIQNRFSKSQRQSSNEQNCTTPQVLMSYAHQLSYPSTIDHHHLTSHL